MREIATLADQHDAQVLVDYLLTQDIPAVVRLENHQAEIWIRNEDDVDLARIICEEFRSQPKDVKYRAAARPAKELRKLQDQVNKKYAALYKETDDFWGRPRPSKIPITMALIVLSIIATIYIDFGKNNQRFMQLAITDQSAVILPQQWEGKDNRAFEKRIWEQQWKPLQRGEYYRLITPIFLHLHILHLALNMYALYTLGGLIECRRNKLWVISFVLVTGIFSNLSQFIFPDAFNFNLADRFLNNQGVIIGSHLFGGMSGVCYALFGYLTAKSLYSPEPGLVIPRDSIYIMMGWLVLCMTGALGDIANTAHVAGMVIGVVIGMTPKFIDQMRKRLAK